MPADFGDEIADRPFAWSCRRPGSDLLVADDEQWIHLRKRQYRDARSGLRRHADPSQAPRQRETGLRAVEFLRIWWNQCVGRVQASGCLKRPAGPEVQWRSWAGRT